MQSGTEGTGRSTRKRGRRGKPRKQTSIDGVMVEDPFTLSLPKNDDGAQNHAPLLNGGGESVSTSENGNAASAGDGCYVSTTIQNRRYYGVLFEQNALKAASMLYFENEAGSLELNRRMVALNGQRIEEENAVQPPQDGEANDAASGPESKKQKVSCEPPTPESVMQLKNDVRAVQKFRFVEEPSGPGYRVLVATYANIVSASEDDVDKALLIEKACQSGGNFVGKYYYQFEVLDKVLHGASAKDAASSSSRYRLSMGMDTFLRNTSLPSWYPLSNLECGQSKIMSMLKMKANRKGNIVSTTGDGDSSRQGLIPMEPRSAFRVGVVGGGIAGLACAHELLRLANKADHKLDVEVVLLEAQPRVGGRLKTDHESFKASDGSTPFPVDLGASWIHGIIDNPLTALSREAGVDLITSNEDVKMLGSSMKEVDNEIDEKMGKLFDALLDQGAQDCWSKEEHGFAAKTSQHAVRWYGSVLGQKEDSEEVPQASDPPQHRRSLDVSIDNAIGAAMKNRREFERLSDEEHNLLHWYTKNAEYALGANIQDLSMMYWDTDETHAFEGDHVFLKQGYSSIAELLRKKCENYGDAFKLLMDWPCGKIEFARNSTSQPYPHTSASAKMIDLSDSCRVTSRDGKESFNFDFVVCAVPLGVLKDSVDSDTGLEASPVPSSDATTDPRKDARLTFEPPLPQLKRDAINNVGFGLLNKVYLQFPAAFWRMPADKASLRGTPFLANGLQDIFGNASGHNPHHYMFLDVGCSLSDRNQVDSPAILMTLISGAEAVAAEQMSEQALTDDVLSTLQHLFSDIDIPAPIAVKITKWGSDEFSRGCYTFLPPGTSDQDYHILQSAVNARGESYVLGKSESMRLFFCGEHTTSLHPSMAHGAYLSGLRAAKEVITSTVPLTKDDEAEERPIPLSMFRLKTPHAPLLCSLCNLPGSRKREGALLALQRGPRRLLVHNNCAVFSPEVGLHEGTWENVFRAASRGKQLACVHCGKNGATIGCTYNDCLQSYHFLCSEDTGWNFERDGKEFVCDQHRRYVPQSKRLSRISVNYYLTKHPLKKFCSLCKGCVDCHRRGKLLGFQQNSRQLLVHSNCLTFTSILDTILESEDDDTGAFTNVFETVSSSKECERCQRYGATIHCSTDHCSSHFHYTCAEDTGWNFAKGGRKFVCPQHARPANGVSVSAFSSSSSSVVAEAPSAVKGPVQHDLFCKGAATVGNEAAASHRAPRSRNYQPSNEYVYKGSSLSPPSNRRGNDALGGDSSSDSDNSIAVSGGETTSVYEAAMTSRFVADPQLVDKELGRWHRVVTRAHRPTFGGPWGLCLCVEVENSSAIPVLKVDRQKKQGHGLEPGDIVISINEVKIGSEQIKNFISVVELMKGSLELRFEVLRRKHITSIESAFPLGMTRSEVPVASQGENVTRGGLGVLGDLEGAASSTLQNSH